MSDTIQPINQIPTACDFGPFAGALCYKKNNLKLELAASDISLSNIVKATNENTSIQIELADAVTSVSPIDWSKTLITNLSGATVTRSGSVLTFVPDTAGTSDRAVNFNFTIEDTLGLSKIGNIKVNISDLTPTVNALNVSLSGDENMIFTIDITKKVTVTNTEIDWVTGLTIAQQPSEGIATISDGKITYTPTETPSVNRSITIKYKVISVSGIMDSASIVINLADITPALTATDFTINLLDTASKTIDITSYLTIKNDSFKSVIFDTPTEGTIVVTGNSVKFTPNEDLSENRTITVGYTATTTTDLVDTGIMTIVISDDNIWAGSIWYGNSTLDTMDETGIVALSDTSRQQDFPGTYIFSAGETGTQVYKWVIYPKAWGEPLMIIDPLTGFEVSVDDYKYVTVGGVELLMIRTYYQLNGSFTIKLI